MLKNIKTRITLMLLMVIISVNSQADQDELTNKELYYKNLTMVYILVENVEFFKQECESAFPEFSQANQAAFDIWKMKHQAFNSEINGYVNNLIFESAINDGIDIMEAKKTFDEKMSQGQQLILKSLIEHTDDGFQSWCNNYSNYTKSKGDVVNTFNDKVITMYEARLMMLGEIEDDKLRPSEEEVPVFHITREQLDNLEIETVGQLMKLLSAKLLIPEREATYQTIKKQFEQTDNKIIEDTGDSVLVQSYNENEETGKMEPAFQSRYFFKDGILARGPVLVDPGNIKVTKITGMKIK